MHSKFIGNGFFVFSDPGGAKPILALTSNIKKQLNAFKIISDRSYNFYQHFDLTVEFPIGEPSVELTSFSPDFLFTGTSYTSHIELDYIEAARNLGILSYSFVDHWTNIYKRFTKNEKQVFPDKVLVADQTAYSLALKQKIPEQLLAILPNPFLSFLESWRPKRSKQATLTELGIEPSNKILVVFAPDPLSNVQGQLTYGFDEISATSELRHVADALKETHLFILLPHPNQNTDLLEPVLGRSIKLIKNGCSLELSYHADIVVGFFSNFLLEAAHLGKSIVRYLPTQQADPLQHKQFGQIINSSSSLQAWLTGSYK